MPVPSAVVASPLGDGIFDPVIVLSPPRSGSTLLFETLARSPDLATLGDESHAVIEALPSLHPSAHGYDSNRLTTADATPAVVAALRRAFRAAMHDRDGRTPASDARVRLLEKTPKNSLRVPFLRAVFPDARFVYLHRDPRETVASMIEAWLSGAFVTYSDLPGWRPDLPWSMLLTPGWREWREFPVAGIAARQWAAATTQLLDDLALLPRDQVLTVRYGQLVADPAWTIAALCRRLDLRWDVALEASLPAARSTVSAPAPDKWRRRERELHAAWPLLADAAMRAERFLAD